MECITALPCSKLFWAWVSHWSIYSLFSTLGLLSIASLKVFQCSISHQPSSSPADLFYFFIKCIWPAISMKLFSTHLSLSQFSQHFPSFLSATCCPKLNRPQSYYPNFPKTFSPSSLQLLLQTIIEDNIAHWSSCCLIFWVFFISFSLLHFSHWSPWLFQ